jgi:hypothetical protein
MPPIFAEVGIVQLRNRTLSPAARLAIGILQAQVASASAADSVLIS